MIVPLCLLSIANISAGFALATALGRRYRKIAARQLWASLTVKQQPIVLPAVPAVAPAPTPAPTHAAARAADGPPAPKSPGHLAIDDLQGQVSDFGAKLIEVDERLRQCAGAPDLGTIETVLSNIENTARNFAESRDAAQQRVADLTHGDGPWEGINNELAVAAQMQDAEIKATRQEIANFDYESDLAGGCQKIVGCTHRLLNANDMLSDALQKAMAEVVQQESCPPEEADRSDPLTGCINPRRHRTRPGHVVGRRDRPRAVVRGDGRHRSPGRDQRAVRLPRGQRNPQGHRAAAGRQPVGQRPRGPLLRAAFPAHVFGHGPAGGDQHHRALPANDRLAHFEHKDFDIRITVSCALTRANNEDSPSSMLLRVEAALREAKRYGHNRTFVHEGKYPTPAVPPELTIEPLHIAV